MLKLESLRNDLLTSADGERVESNAFPGVAYHVRSLRFPAYETARDLAAQKMAKAYPNGGIPSALTMKTVGELISDHILLGWEGLDVPYTKDRAREILSDFGYRKVVNDIESCAARVGERDLEFIEDTAKNSGQPSAMS